MRRRLPMLGFLLCLGAWTQPAPPTVGFVLSIDGPWQIQGRALRQGVLSNLGNPKMAVFFASLLPQFAPTGSASFAILLALGFLFCAMTFVWLTFYAVAVARLGRLMTGTLRRALDAVTGVVLIALGLRLATDR